MRVTVRTFVALMTTVPLLACHEPTQPQDAALESVAAQSNAPPLPFIIGDGHINLSAVAGAEDAKFWFHAKLKPDGTARGFFYQRRIRNGLRVEFSGQVTCLTVDAALGRARVGGIITANNSTDPAFLTENHEVGDDVWFRVQDDDVGGGAVDASTTYGFKPTLVNTSAEYCALPFTGLPAWNPATTFPLRSGSIQVNP